MIEIGGYKIHKCDDYNWCVEAKRKVKEGKNKGQDAWGNRKYYPKLEQAALYLFDKLVSKEDINSVGSMLEAILSAKEDIVSAVGQI